jgi:hypothetical protein
MTTLPDLEPAALEAARKEYTASLAYGDFGATERIIRAYLAARSTVPEAGKAVDAGLIERLNKFASDLHGQHSGTSRWSPYNPQAELVREAAAALTASEAEATSLRRKLEEAERDNALKLCSLADTMTACRGDDDFIAGVRAKIEAALSTEPGEPEGHTVEISRMGWEEDEGEQRFTATAVFKDPPNWPFNVVWKRIPVRMALAAPLPEDTHHGR